MAIDERIENLRKQIRRVDGHTKLENIGNRIHGSAGIGLGAITYYFGLKYFNYPVDTAFYIMGTLVVIEGIGELATGKLHYLSLRVTKLHPRYELESLEKEKRSENNEL